MDCNPTAEGAPELGPVHADPLRSGRRLDRTTGSYAVLVLVTLFLIRQIGERWWPVTLLIFMPRWLFLLPLIPLVLAAGWRRRRRLWIAHGIIALMIAGPLMRVSLPIGRDRATRPAGFRLRIMTFNRGMKGIHADRLIRLIEREQIQVICLQEGGGDPVLRAYWEKGWYRTDFVASRFPVLTVSRPPADDVPYPPHWRSRLELVRIRASSGLEFVVASVHLDTVRHGLESLRSGHVESLSRHNAWRRNESEKIAGLIAEERETPVLVGGDFNMPSDSPMFAPLRERFQVGFDESGCGYGYTYPAALPWLRIDHLLASPHWTVSRCWVGPDLGSDHLPLIAEVVLTTREMSRPTRSRPGIGHNLESIP